VVAARPAPGQASAAEGLRAQLAGGTLAAGGAARRIQDPLSFRCAAQLHGALETALGWLADALAPELAGAADNPLVLGDDAEILSTGNFQVSALALALDAAALAVAQVAHGIAERVARLTEQRLSGLPGNLIDPALPGAATHSGVGAVGKTAHALVLEIRHAAAPLSIGPAIVADGVEDDSTGAAQGALRLGEQITRLQLLVAVELLVAAQAVDVAGIQRLGAGTAAAQRSVRDLSAPLGEDRPLGPEIERIAATLVAGGRLRVATEAAVNGVAR
jgi:histidine ammonia-lyase